MSAGPSHVELTLGERSTLDPQLWFYAHEYGALKAHDKTVITQIETGSVVADVAPMLTLAISVPWVYTLTFERAPGWRFSGSAGLSPAFRIPVGAIEGSNAVPRRDDDSLGTAPPPPARAVGR